MPSASTIAAFAAASLLLLLIPGPAVLYIVNRSVSDGRRAGLAAVAGLTLGNLVHALAAAVGLSAVLATSATAFNTVKWLGAGYLVYVGVRTLMRPAPAIDPDQPGVSARRSFTQGVVVNVLNPK
ncbi:MAG: LysE family translocator, partial [Actinomycetota bacterium]|nr:LysE family translocator [Actinomycetota bacterium]